MLIYSTVPLDDNNNLFISNESEINKINLDDKLEINFPSTNNKEHIIHFDVFDSLGRGSSDALSWWFSCSSGNPTLIPRLRRFERASAVPACVPNETGGPASFSLEVHVPPALKLQHRPGLVRRRNLQP